MSIILSLLSSDILLFVVVSVLFSAGLWFSQSVAKELDRTLGSFSVYRNFKRGMMQPTIK
jgi:hypothetical protein